MTPFPLLFWNRSAWILILTIQLPEKMEAHKVPINSCQNCLINQRTKTRTVDISMQCCLDMPGRKHGESKKKKKNQLPLKANCTWLNPHSFPFEKLKKQRHLIRLILLFFIHACKCRIKTQQYYRFKILHYVFTIFSLFKSKPPCLLNCLTEKI